MNARTTSARALGLPLLILGVMTLVEGGKVVTGNEAAVLAAGDYVPFVVWTNFLAGPFYVLAGLGLMSGRAQGGRLAQVLALVTAGLGLAFIAHVLSGGAYETRTAVALTVRTVALGLLGTLGHWLLSPASRAAAGSDRATP